MDSQKSNFQNPQFMLILSANCNAECSYCFGPHKGKITSKHVINNSKKFIEKISAESNQEKINITFHGGEPLIAPISLWTFTLEKLISAFRNKQLSLSVQSNLWNLNDNFCRLFKKYNISIGTSLDGPKEVNDKQRGKGYFEKTFKGIDLASKHGLDVGCISTFTPVNLYKWKDIMDFFKSEKISFSVHPSIRPLNCTNNDDLFLNSVQYGFLLSSMLKEYLKAENTLRLIL